MALILCLLLSLAIGAQNLSLGQVWHGLVTPGADGEASVVRRLRVPRSLAALLVGVALAVAGALMQAVTRNPLADPGLLGVNAGAALAVVLVTLLVGTSAPVLLVVWFAMAGAAASAVTVYLVGSSRRTGASPVRLALAGVAVTAVLNGIIQVLLLRNPQVFEQFRFWRVGSVARADGRLVLQLLPFVVVGVLIALTVGPMLNNVALGDDVARSLGGNVARTRVWTTLAVVLLCGAATAAVGPIAFVGLAIPHLARLIVGPDQRWILAYSLVLGPLLVLMADVIGRVVVGSGEMQVGMVIALIGAPVLIWVIRRGRLSEL